MDRSTVSACHSLKIVPIDSLRSFALLGSRVYLSYIGSPIDMKAVPGTLLVSATSENGIIKKTITFERADVSDLTSDALERLSRTALIALYTDESGKERVAGTISWPLALSFSIGEGVCSVVLSGEDTIPDPFLFS